MVICSSYFFKNNKIADEDINSIYKIQIYLVYSDIKQIKAAIALEKLEPKKVWDFFSLLYKFI